MATAMKQLYNGNISHVVTSINGLSQKTQASVYEYDQLQRLKGMTVYRDGNLAANNYWATASTASTSEYQSSYSYDQNGNLTALVRNGYVSAGPPALGLSMDNFTYNYTAGTNKLSSVSDAVTSENYTDDINSGQSSGNYQYDKIGQLVSDSQEGVTNLSWRFGDKKLKSEKGASKYVEFIYNPFGQRVVKITKDVVSGSIRNQEDGGGYSWLYTYYAYDANGQVMATYDVTMNSGAGVQKAIVSEQHLYGAGRLGMVQPDKEIYNGGYTLPVDPALFSNYLGKKNYEMTNYLGNVNAVVTDRKMVTQNVQLNVVNTFFTGFDAWSAFSGTFTYDSPNQQLKMVQTGTSGYVFKNFTTTVGEDYVVAISATNGTAPALTGSAINTTTSAVLATSALTSGSITYFRFTATSTTTRIQIKPSSGSGSMTYYVQDVAIKSRAKYTAVAVMSSDYYPFGMQMPGRSVSVADYRYGYNGMEKDNEIKGTANSYTTEFRQYDPRLGRWKSLDPLMHIFPNMSPYCAFANNPIYFTDPYGLAPGGPGGANEGGGAGDKTKRTYNEPQKFDLVVFEQKLPKSGFEKGDKIHISFSPYKGTTHVAGERVSATYTFDGEGNWQQVLNTKGAATVATRKVVGTNTSTETFIDYMGTPTNVSTLSGSGGVGGRSDLYVGGGTRGSGVTEGGKTPIVTDMGEKKTVNTPTPSKETSAGYNDATSTVTNTADITTQVVEYVAIDAATTVPKYAPAVADDAAKILKVAKVAKIAGTVATVIDVGTNAVDAIIYAKEGNYSEAIESGSKAVLGVGVAYGTAVATGAAIGAWGGPPGLVVGIVISVGWAWLSSLDWSQ